MKMNAFAIAAAALFTVGLSGNAAADGAALYTAKACNTCHGADGKTPIMPSYPKLAGQNSDYAVAQIKDIRDGKRTNGMTAAMKPMVAALTDAEIKEISDYLAGLH
jgi:cytochrome c